jgi:hypothetical protein
MQRERVSKGDAAERLAAVFDRYFDRLPEDERGVRKRALEEAIDRIGKRGRGRIREFWGGTGTIGSALQRIRLTIAG